MDGEDLVLIEDDADCVIIESEVEVVDLTSDDESKLLFQHSNINATANNDIVRSISENEQKHDVFELICIDEQLDSTFNHDERSDAVMSCRSSKRFASEQPSEDINKDDTEISTVSSRNSSPNLEAVKSEVPKRILTKLRDLLDTGILEGVSVQYKNLLKVNGSKETMMRGVIKGSGILCGCRSCNGNEVVTPTQFLIHAGSSSKRPRECICLDNGNTLNDVWNVYEHAQLHTLEENIKKVIGCSTTALNSATCLKCRGSIPNDMAATMTLCTSCFNSDESHDPCSERHDDAVSSAPRPCKNIIKRSSKGNNSSAKITKKDLRLHKLVFEADVLQDGTEVAYCSRGQKLLVGYKKGHGIFCTCCNSEVSPSQFEAHAGLASRRKPYLHIYTSDGVSLHDLSLSLLKGQKFSVSENDDLCSICEDGGVLLCCDGCPRAFHRECISLSCLPEGIWYCKYCETLFRKQRIIDRGTDMSAGHTTTMDSVEQIYCTRIVKSPEAEYGGCVLCRSHGFSNCGFGFQTVIICDQCEKEYHVGCLKKHGIADLKELPEGLWFCCTFCCGIHHSLDKLVVRGKQKVCESLSNVLRKAPGGENHDVCWRLLKGKIASEKTRTLLSKAVAIFHERFDPITEAGIDRDYIPQMVYGRNMKGQEFGNMLCAVLIVNSLVVSTGLFRVFGRDVAEIPLVATAKEFEGMGYLRCLFSCIERSLGSLGVKNLLLPAADEAMSIWTKAFGFMKLHEDRLHKYRTDHALIMAFEGTSLLHKHLPGFSD